MPRENRAELPSSVQQLSEMTQYIHFSTIINISNLKQN